MKKKPFFCLSSLVDAGAFMDLGRSGHSALDILNLPVG